MRPRWHARRPDILPAVATVLLLGLALAGTPSAARGQDSTLVDLMETVWGHGPERALDRYRSLDSGARSPDLLLSLADQLLWTGKRRAALAVLREAESVAPGRSRLWLLKGRAFAETGDRWEALRQFRRGLRMLESDTALSGGERDGMARRLENRIGLLESSGRLTPRTGPYRAPDGTRYLFKFDPYLITFPSLVDASTGVSHVLYPDTSGALYWRNGDGERTGSIRFDGAPGNRGTLTLSAGERKTSLRGLRICREEIEIDVGFATVSASLFRPDGPGPFPALVLSHGAGRSARYNLAHEASAFAAAGIAALVYDKPGLGLSSDGNWFMLSIAEQARIVAAAADTLERRSDVSSVGAWGFSQGGWVVPRAAERSDAIDLLVLASGAAVPPQEQADQAMRARMDAAGMPDSAVASARAHMSEVWRRVNRGLPPDSFADLDARADSAPWGRFVRRIQLQFQVDWWRANELDTGAALRAISVPVLALYGSEDRNVPPAENVPRMIHLLAAAPTRDVTVWVLPDADHQFRSGDDYQPLYFRSMTEWVRHRTGEPD